MNDHTDHFFIDSAHRTIDLETAAVSDLRRTLGPPFAEACRRILGTRGRVVVTGMGKVATLLAKSLPLYPAQGPRFFLHPAEASHGDMGMITREDCVIALSNSGGTHEIITLLPLIKRLGVPLISITGDADSELATASDVHLHAAVESEACPWA